MTKKTLCIREQKINYCRKRFEMCTVWSRMLKTEHLIGAILHDFGDQIWDHRVISYV